jgi:uncharacterized protein YbjQ (UPF0145 family)
MSQGDNVVPEAAQARMRAEREGGNWSSDLSAAELAAVHHAGFEPVDFVMGSSIYHIGAQWNGGWNGWQHSYYCTWGGYGNEHWIGYNWEHTQYEAGVYDAYQLALGRLTEEARQVNAHGVVGVRVNMSHMEGVGGTIEFTAFGTAIKRRSAPALPQPFTSHLSGVEFNKLIQTGYIPTTLVYAVASVQINESCQVEHQERSMFNGEITQIADGIRWARESAIGRLADVSGPLGKHVIGVTTDFSMHEIGTHQRLVHMSALGTVVHEFADVPLPKEPMPIMRLK